MAIGHLAAAGAFDSGAVAELFFAIGLILGVARLLGELARHYGQPPIVGEIAAGILLGKTVLGRVSPQLYEGLLGSEASPAAAIGLQAVMMIAAALLLLVAGLEVDLNAVRREKKATAWVSAISMIIPFGLGFGVAYGVPELIGGGPDEAIVFPLFIGIALSITALPVIAKILMDLALQRSSLGVVVLASAVVNDLVGWIGFASVLALAGSGDGNVMKTIGMTVGFAIFCLTIGRKMAKPVLVWAQAHGGWPSGVVGVVFVIAFFAAAITEWIGVHAIFGAFLAGVLFADSGRLRHRTQQSIEDVVGAVFAPLFFAAIALKVDFIGNFSLSLVVVVMIIAIVGKMIGGWLGATIAGMGRRESWAVGAGMTARGAMEIILAELALEAGIINDELFVAIVVMAIVTSVIAGPAIEKILQRKSGESLLPLLGRNAVVLDIEADGDVEAIGNLARAAKLSPTIEELILQRERQLPTGLPGGWALPHCVTDEVDSPKLAIGVLRESVDFSAPDGLRAKLLVLLVTPRANSDLQPQLLASLARVLGDNGVRKDVIAAGSANEVKATIRMAEAARNEHG